jgi:multidrug efflux pump subunit AcrB
MRAAPGTRIEETEKLAKRVLDIVAREVGPDNVEITLGFVGVQNPAYPINMIHLWTSGPEEAMLQVQLREKTAIGVPELKERLRKILPEELPGIRLSFEPSDIISRVMSFGAPTPIEVAVTGPDFAKSRQFAETIRIGCRACATGFGVPAGIGLPGGEGRHRPRDCRDARCDRGSDRPFPHGCDVFQSVYDSQFLA